MPIPEAQLSTWSHQGSIAQSAATYQTVKAALEAADTKYADKRYNVFLQGSYGNDTNIYAESDVDVVMRLTSIYYYDVSALTPTDLAIFNAGLNPATYSYQQYKTDVIAALVKRFGEKDVAAENRAVKIKANGSRRSVDVVVAVEFRRYYSRVGGPQFAAGICFFDSSSQRIVNYPTLHSDNCVAKHKSTKDRFKPMVRVFKNLRSRLVDDRLIEKGSAPSYFLEGLLYNVPDDKFGTSYGGSFVDAVNWIRQAKRDELVCANRQLYLVRDQVSTCWPCGHFDRFLTASVELWNKWS